MTPITKFRIFQTDGFWGVVTLLVGYFVLAPYLNFQEILSQGDHGRDLYAFAQTANGAVPYRDYWWVYGPLMPYIYGFLMKTLGVTIHSVLVGKFLITLAAGLFFFRSLSLFVPAWYACIGAVWFYAFQEDFFYTYNHVGGILLLIISLHNLLHYVVRRRLIYLWMNVGTITLLFLVKLNFGFVGWVHFMGTLILMRRSIMHDRTLGGWWIYASAIIDISIVVGLSYFLSLRSLEVYQIRQCLPFLSSDHPHNASIFSSAWKLIEIYALSAQSNMVNICFTVLCSLGLLKLGHVISTETSPDKKRALLFAIGLPASLYVLTLHEYLLSGLDYRMHWSEPFRVFCLILAIGITSMHTQKLVRSLIAVALVCLISLQFGSTLQSIARKKTPEHFLSLPRGQVFIGNDLVWIKTVRTTVDYLQNSLSPKEPFFALPYDPLYYFLLGKPSPTRQLIFYEHINITENQEKRILKELADKQIQWILISNFHKSKAPGLGALGHTHSPLIGKYINDHYSMVAKIGNWVDEPGWAWNHGVKILRKNNQK